jgi:hypothetical protein
LSITFSSLPESYQEEFKELTANWTTLEGKAQNIVTIAGIFVAGVFAYIRETKVENQNFEKVFLIFSIFCLIGSIVWAMRALKVRKVAKSPFGKNTDNLAEGITKISNEEGFLRFKQGLFGDLKDSWCKTRESVITANENKAENVRIANKFLVSAIISVALVSIFKLLFLMKFN